MKLKTELMVLCDYASVSREGKLSINGIFDEVRVTNLPGGLARAFLVATVSGASETTYKLIFKLEHNGETILPPNNVETKTSLNGKNNIIIELVGMNFPKEGDYELKMYHDDNEIGATKIKVIHTQQTPTFKMPN